MYYIIESKYVGPNPSDDRNADADVIEISRTPAYTNSSNELCIKGWCGTIGDYSTKAHGEYETLEEAQRAVVEIFGEVRDRDQWGQEFYTDNENVVIVYKPGKYRDLGANETGDFVYEAVNTDITAATTDEEIEKLVEQYEVIANEEGLSLWGGLEKNLQKLRDDMQPDEDDVE